MALPPADAFVQFILCYERISVHVCVCVLCFWKELCLGVVWCVDNVMLQQFPSLLTAETNYVCNAGLSKRFLTARQYD